MSLCPGRTKPFWCAWFKRDCDLWGRADARLCSAFLGGEAEGRSDTAGKWEGEVRICKGIDSRRGLVGDSLSPKIKTNENGRQQMQIPSKGTGLLC